MAKISIDKTQPGMVVTEKVVNDKGMVLLPPGTVLTEALISRLQKWNVQSVSIKGDGPPAEAAPEGAQKISALDDALLEKLNKKFHSVLGDPLMKTLLDAVKTHYQNQEKKPA